MINPLRLRGFAAASAVVAVVAALPFARGLLSGHAFFFRDLSLHFFPLRRFALDGLRAAELRYWNPYLHEGIPSPFPPISYPIELLQLLRPDEWGLSVVLALHVPLAALAFMALGRHLGLAPTAAAAGSLVYALGGFSLSTLNLYVYAEAMAWAPLVILGARRAAAGGARDVALGAVATAMAWSTVGTEIVLQSILAAVVLSWPSRASRAALLRIAGTLLLGLGLSAPTTGVMSGVVAGSERARGFTTAVVLAQSIHPLTLLQVVIGDFYGDLSDVANRWWGENFFPRGFPYFLSLYLGAATLATAAVGARWGRALRVRLVVLGLLAVVVGLGRWGVIGWVVEALPLLRRLRFPSKAFFTVHLAVSLLAALGIDALAAGRRPAWRWLAAAGLSLGGLLVAVLVLPSLAPGFVRYFIAGFFPPDEAWPLRQRQLAHMLRDAATGGTVALGAAGLAVAVLRGRVRPGLAIAGLAALLAADLLRTGAGLNPMVTAGFYRLSPEMTGQLPVLRDGSRLFVCEPVRTRAYWAGRALHPESHESWTFETYRETLTPDFNLLARVPTALSDDLTSLVPVGAAPARDLGCDRIGLLAGRLRAAGVGHVVSLDPLADPSLRERAVVAPSRIAPVAVHVYDVDPRGPGRLSLVGASGAEVPGRAELVRDASDEVEIQVDTAAAATLVLRDGQAPGWQAWVDDIPTPVGTAEGHYRAVGLTAGIHRVRLAYRPPGLRIGLGVMAAALGVLGALWWRPGRRAALGRHVASDGVTAGLTSDAGLTARLRQLRERPDFQRRPLRALGRRLWWRLRWRLTGRLWIRTWRDGLRIALPRGGPAALIYYQGLSEPETAGHVSSLLAPGMTFADVGAHIGEYTLLAARRVGESGEVHAFEPDARAYEVLVENVRLNGLERIVRPQPWAVSDADGESELSLGAEPALSVLATVGSQVTARPDGRRVRTVTLDSFFGPRRLDLVKIDVEGAELLVVRGALQLLARPSPEAPVLVFECAAHNYARFGYAPSDLFRLLAGVGYSVWRYDPSGLRRQDRDPPPGVTVNLIAAKDARRLALLAEAR